MRSGAPDMLYGALLLCIEQNPRLRREFSGPPSTYSAFFAIRIWLGKTAYVVIGILNNFFTENPFFRTPCMRIFWSEDSIKPGSFSLQNLNKCFGGGFVRRGIFISVVPELFR